MDEQYPSGVSDYSPTTSSERRQNLARAGKPNRAVPCSNIGGDRKKERDSEQDDGSGVSNYSPRPHHLATSRYHYSGEEGSYSPTSPRYSPTSPRYSRAGSRLAVSDYSSGEENYNGTSDVGLRKAKRSEKRQRSLEIDTTGSSEDMQLANEKIRKTPALPHPSSSHTGEAVGAQSEDGELSGFALWVRGGHPATKKQKRKRASTDFVQFLITQNQNLAERLEKVEIALSLVQSQTELHKKPETSITGDEYARKQHGSVATGDPETVKTGCALQRERLRLVWDACIVACLVVGIIVLLKLPKLLDAVVGLMDQKTKNLRFEHSANCDAGQ